MLTGMTMEALFLFLQLYLSAGEGTSAANLVTTKLRPSVCGDGRCLCHNNVANCSYGGLTYIPKLNRNITEIVFSHNILGSLSESSWENITAERIVKLDIRWCKIQNFQSSTFKEFKNIVYLKLSNNPVHQDDLAAAMTVPNFKHLRYLLLSNLSISDISFFLRMKSPKLLYLDLNNNRLTVYNQSLFHQFRHLKFMYTRNNQISFLSFDYSNSLCILDFLNNLLINIPSFCDGGNPYFPHLEVLTFDFNRIKYRRGMLDCLPRLHDLHLSGIRIRNINRNSFNDLPQIKMLILMYLPRDTHIRDYAFNNSNLEVISLAKSNIDIGLYVEENAFKNLPKLTGLNIRHNSLESVNNERMIKLFGHLHNLERINMGYCSLDTIPIFINNLTKLTHLLLFGNKIKTIPDGSFAQLRRLSILELDMNDIATIKESAIPKNIRERLHSINLAQNPFDCDCNLQWFIDWTRKNKTLFMWSPQHYVCKSPSSKISIPLKNIFFSPNSCLLSLSIVTAILGTSAVFVVIVTTLSVLYKLRWRIRHYIYMKYYRPRRQLNQEDLQEYTYDAYIIHSEEDEDFVVEEMIPCLEDENDMKLCVPSRDFLPGNYILDNIDTAIQASRHIIVVLSPSFVESEWCQAELSMAQSFVIETRGNALLAVLLEEPDARNMRHSLHVLLKSTAYIIWGEEKEARQLFWRRLVESLRHNGQMLGN